MSNQKIFLDICLKKFFKVHTIVVMTKDYIMHNKSNISTKKNMTQCDMALAYMREQGKINPIDALQAFGCFSLSQRIGDLKKKGHNIVTERVTKLGYMGKSVSFAEYHLIDTCEVKYD